MNTMTAFSLSILDYTCQSSFSFFFSFDSFYRGCKRNDRRYIRMITPNGTRILCMHTTNQSKSIAKYETRDNYQVNHVKLNKWKDWFIILSSNNKVFVVLYSKEKPSISSIQWFSYLVSFNFNSLQQILIPFFRYANRIGIVLHSYPISNSHITSSFLIKIPIEKEKKKKKKERNLRQKSLYAYFYHAHTLPFLT